MTKSGIDAAIARAADQELLYDQPYEDNKRLRVTGPFTVESLSPHRRLTVQDKKELAEKPVGGWRVIGPDKFGTAIIDNLRKAGIQTRERRERLKFDNLQPFAGEWIHATGEFKGADGKQKRVAVCIGPEHGTVGPELVKEAAKEASRGLGYDLLYVCGFAFDPHVDEEARRYGNLNVQICRMNPDLSMGDELLKKTGAGNLFMVFGEPDVVVESEEWMVDSKGRRVARYEFVKRLSGLGSLEEINRAGGKDPAYFRELSKRGTIRVDLAGEEGGGVSSGQHRGGSGEEQHGGIHPVSRSRKGVRGRGGDSASAGTGVQVPDTGPGGAADGRASGNPQNALRPDEITALQTLTTTHYPLSTIHYLTVTIHGVDVYDPTTGEIRNNSTDDIACWFIDTDYDEDSFFVRHAYFTGADQPYEKLKRALRADINEAAWSALYSTKSQPFPMPGKKGKIAVKVINHYGDEVLKVYGPKDFAKAKGD